MAGERAVELDRTGEKKKRRFIGDDEAKLAEAALSYLNRYDTTKARLRKVLERKLDPALDGKARASAKTKIEALLVRLESSRVLDDQRYAENLTQSLRARGASARGIAQKLRLRGVEAGAVTGLSQTPSDELSAARIFVKKRRLIERHAANGPAGRAKALAALGRQGFSFDVARRALELEGAEGADSSEPELDE